MIRNQTWLFLAGVISQSTALSIAHGTSENAIESYIILNNDHNTNLLPKLTIIGKSIFDSSGILFKQALAYTPELFSAVVVDLKFSVSNVSNDLDVKCLKDTQDQLSDLLRSFKNTQVSDNTLNYQNIINSLNQGEKILEHHYDNKIDDIRKNQVSSYFDKLRDFLNQLSHVDCSSIFKNFLQDLIDLRLFNDEIKLEELYPSRSGFLTCINCEKLWAQHTTLNGKRAEECLLCGHEDIKKDNLHDFQLVSSQKKQVAVSLGLITSGSFFE